MTDLQLEDLRQQMTDLRQQLDRQEIVNERLMRQTMTNKMSWIKRFVWLEIVIVPLCLLLFAPMHAALGLSWWLFAFMALILVADVVADYCINRVDRNQLLSGNLVDASRRLTAMKRQRAWAFALGIVGVMIWLVWLLMELRRVAGGFDSNFTDGFAQGVFIGVIIGGVIGVIIAVMVYRKMQRTNDEVIANIDQLTQ